jgi:hypothetical protein
LPSFRSRAPCVHIRLNLGSSGHLRPCAKHIAPASARREWRGHVPEMRQAPPGRKPDGASLCCSRRQNRRTLANLAYGAWFLAGHNRRASFFAALRPRRASRGLFLVRPVSGGRRTVSRKVLGAASFQKLFLNLSPLTNCAFAPLGHEGQAGLFSLGVKESPSCCCGKRGRMFSDAPTGKQRRQHQRRQQ